MVQVQAFRLGSVRIIEGGSIPWEVHSLAAEEYERRYPHLQSAEQLSLRGGFDWCELVAALRGELTPSGLSRATTDLIRHAKRK
jgi:hypothetical protein